MPSTPGYPAYFVGQRITATLLQSGTERTAYKTASTARSSTTTRTADPDLSLDVEANALYRLMGEMFWTSGAVSTADWSGAFTGPAGMAGNWSHSSLFNTIATAFNEDQQVARGITDATDGGILANFTASTKIGGWVDTAGTAGTFTWTWAQRTSIATSTVLEAYSFITLLRVG